ncbi:MAG: zf-HC2 domain-containing protein [Gemmatimonadota bacterium]
MNCEKAVDLIIDALMDSLDDEQERQLREHIASCDSCALEAERMSRMWSGLGDLEEPKAGPAAAVEFGARLAGVSGRRRLAPWLRVAATIALLAIGGTAGFLARGGAAPPPGLTTSGSTFLLLVRGDVSDAVDGTQTVQEYRAWATSLAQEGRLVGANKLTEEPGRWISGPAGHDTRSQSDVSGYFLVNAASYGEAIRIAESSPHIKYGGTFEIRQIDAVDTADGPSSVTSGQRFRSNGYQPRGLEGPNDPNETIYSRDRRGAVPRRGECPDCRSAPQVLGSRGDCAGQECGTGQRVG